uniref:Uncharacterized protein n=1 Tax=Acrobeloides nanus TaxID=290746 RepID=A0A914CZ09_9BILA
MNPERGHQPAVQGHQKIGFKNGLQIRVQRPRKPRINKLRHDNCEVDENLEILRQATEQHPSTFHVLEDQNNAPKKTPSLTKAPAAQSPYPHRDREKRRILTQMPDRSFD